MKLQVWAEVELPDDDFGETVNDRIAGIQDNYPSLSGLVADLIDGRDESKVIVSCDKGRVVLALHPRLVCPECYRFMVKDDHPGAPWLFYCACGHTEGRVQW